MSKGDVVIRIVRSDGREMRFGDNEWGIPNDGLENFANLSYNVYFSELASYDGALVSSKRVPSIDRSIRAEVLDAKNNSRLRAQAIEFFNPKYSYKCYLTYLGRTRYCEGEQIGFKASEDNIYKPVQIDWTILCPNPYMISDGIYGKNLAETTPRIGFPWVSFLPPEEGQDAIVGTGAIASSFLFRQKVDIVNDGDVESAIRIIITAIGDVLNPTIKIGDKFVRVIAGLKKGDTVEMDATSRPPVVRINGENAMNKLDRRSSILDMVVAVGETWIEYDADDGENNMAVTIYYSRQYLGV